jgi:hypothetical protein
VRRPARRIGVAPALDVDHAPKELTMAQHPPFQRVPHPPIEPNPALVQETERRARSVQNRIADRITGFAGSMRFVYIHIAWFGCWIAFGVEDYPYGLLTMIVSLEAIFLSTFVMISQNRADAKRQVIADQQVADPGACDRVILLLVEAVGAERVAALHGPLPPSLLH